MKQRPDSTWNYNPQAPRAAARGPAAPEIKAQQRGSVEIGSPVHRQEHPGGQGERGATDQRSEGRYAGQGSSGTVKATLPPGASDTRGLFADPRSLASGNPCLKRSLSL